MRAISGDSDQDGRAHAFVIAATPSAQSLMRLLGLFAQRDLLPVSVSLMRTATAMEIRIKQDGLSLRHAEVIREKMLTMPGVHVVGLRS